MLCSIDEKIDLAMPNAAHEPFRHDLGGMPLLGKLYFSGGMRRGLAKFAPAFNVVHAHGLWQMPSIYAAWAASNAGRPLVISPHGMLGADALRFSARRKQGMWKLLQGPAVRGAAMLHATSEKEYQDIRTVGLRQPIAIIPNGIDVPEWTNNVETTRDIILSLGRIHPKKGLDRLIQAWARIAARHPSFRLVIAGPDEGGHLGELRALAASLKVPRLEFVPAVFGEDKWRLYRSSALFVLPTLDENFAVTVAESLASQTPVISTKGAPWADLETHNCGWWIDHGPEPLADALDLALSLPRETRAAMGEAGRKWMIDAFGWRNIGESMLNAYGWLAGSGEQPNCVYLD